MRKRHFFTFYLLQGICWSIAALAYFKTNGFFTDPLGLSFSFFFLIGHIFLFVWLLALLTLPLYWLSPRVCQGACIFGGSLFSGLLAINWLVFSQYRFHIGPSMLELFFGPAGSEIFVFPVNMWLCVGVAFCVIIALETGLLYIARKWAPSNKQMGWIIGAWVLCFAIYNSLYAWGNFMLVPSVVGQRNVLPLAHPLSANRLLTKWGFSPEKRPYVIPQKGHFLYPKHPLTCAPKTSKNVLFLLVDSLRADMLNPQVMPLLHKWTEHPGMHIFANHLSGGNSTAGGIFSLFYSMPQSYWDDVNTIPPVWLKLMWEQGYEPAIFASSKLNSPAFNRNVFSSIENLRLGSAGDNSWQRDEQAVSDFLQFLEQKDPNRPFFGFIFLDAPHAYSYPPQAQKFTPAKEVNYLLLTNTTDPTPYLNQYKNSVYFTDQLIDRVLTALEKQNMLQDTYVVITADHAQELNDSHHNFWGHNSNFTDYQTRVPLLLLAGDTPAQTLNHRTSHYDVVPTLLQNLFQCKNPVEDYSIGQNLFDISPRPFVVFSGHEEKALRIDDNLLIFDSFGGLKQYNNRFEPVTQAPDPARVKAGLKAFSHFYNKDNSAKK